MSEEFFISPAAKAFNILVFKYETLIFLVASPWCKDFKVKPSHMNMVSKKRGPYVKISNNLLIWTHFIPNIYPRHICLNRNLEMI